VRRVAVIANTSGSGKTTVGQELADRLGVPFVELDSLVHGPGWTEISDDGLRQLVEPVLTGEGWVVDGTYQRKLGTAVLDAADTVVWLDMPLHVWLPRLTRRTVRRLIRRETLWNGNRETVRNAVWGRDSLFGFALRMHYERRRHYPEELAGYPVVRLRTPEEVRRFLTGAGAT
jgi:shikimate kinase